MNLHELREKYLQFFQEKEHQIINSYPLVPINDKSLLLINAGMAPLKSYFVGTQTPPSVRMASCQKCIRTGDIENVGKTDRHGTFFEMLGNFSFGDYFKVEAIQWAWEFMTDVLKVDPETLWASVYLEDDEAYEIWRDVVGVPESRLVRLGKEDNFWEHGTGPCGPCSEIYIDRGEKYGCGDPDCKPGCECDRYVEVWNLVFTQFDKQETGEYLPLAKRNIDTGMGLERLTIVLNECANIFEIDPIVKIIEAVEKTANLTYKKDKKTDVSIRVITDHLRAATFMISDGVLPSNEGRGYVLRRLIRRAYRHGKLIGIEKPFLANLSQVVIDNWKDFYKNLESEQAQIHKVLEYEEKKFLETLEQGLQKLETFLDEVKDSGKTELPGQAAFRLYDTFGFPLDLTIEILEEKGFTVDQMGFQKAMEQQQERARAARSAQDQESWLAGSAETFNDYKTEFLGYELDQTEATILAIFQDGVEVDTLAENEKGIVIVDRTTLYGESGGQLGDHGQMRLATGHGQITDTKKNGSAFLHQVKMKQGLLSVGNKVEMVYEGSRRRSTARNHTATHLLHKALQEVLGDHVRQSGSLVSQDRLRFDFTHLEAISHEELKAVELRVNEIIYEDHQVVTDLMTMEEAVQSGATALFSDKYGEKVRVVSVEGYSQELCGGTHVSHSSDIGIFKILHESGIAAGVRRIEAVTGKSAYAYTNELEEEQAELATILRTKKENLTGRVSDLLAEQKQLKKELEQATAQLRNQMFESIFDAVEVVGDTQVLIAAFEGQDVDGLRSLMDRMKNQSPSYLFAGVTESKGKLLLLVSGSEDLVKKGFHAGNMIRAMAKLAGGGGGGRPNMAQAGAPNTGKVDEILTFAKEEAKKFL
jgi:alanyl-tRNA synthetase